MWGELNVQGDRGRTRSCYGCCDLAGKKGLGSQRQTDSQFDNFRGAKIDFLTGAWRHWGMGIDLLSASERDAIISACLRLHLPELGLKEIKPRMWVDGSEPPVRRVFEIQLLKGAGLKACWGFSLDFVPHISAGRVRWHRSDKTALLDIVVDPRDLQQATYLCGAAHLKNELELLAPIAIARAKATWSKGATFHGMLQIIREIRERKTNCFRYDNYRQLPIAYALLCAKTGDLYTGACELQELIKRESLDEDESVRLLAYAREYARTSR